MDRPIEFRAWDKENSKMIYDEEWSSFHEAMTFRGSIYRDGYLKDWVLMQFTGLLDRNGKEIFEGDIFEGLDGLERPIKGLIRYRPEWGRMVIDDDLSLTSNLARKGRVIGNIFENSDLIDEP